MTERETARSAETDGWRGEPRAKSVRIGKIPDYDSLPYKGEVPHYDAVINHSRVRDKGAVRCVMCGSRPGRGSCEIPRQNKDVCKKCDREVFLHLASSIIFKWCKGCKRFLNLAAFAEKPDAAKCFGCRERGRKCYLVKKYLLPAPAAGAFPRTRCDSTAECLTDGDDFSSEGENDSAARLSIPPTRSPSTRGAKQRPAVAALMEVAYDLQPDKPSGKHHMAPSSSQQQQPWRASLGPSPCTSEASASSLSDGEGHFCCHGSEESDLDDSGHEAVGDAYDDSEERAAAVQGLRRLCASLALGSAPITGGAASGGAKGGDSVVPAAAAAAVAGAPNQGKAELAEIRERVIQIRETEAVEAALKQARQASVTWAAEASRLATQLYSLRHGVPPAAGQDGSAAAGQAAACRAAIPASTYRQEEQTEEEGVHGKKRKMEEVKTAFQGNAFAAADMMLVLPGATAPPALRAPMGAAF